MAGWESAPSPAGEGAELARRMRSFYKIEKGSEVDCSEPFSIAYEAACWRRLYRLVEMRRVELLSEIHPHHKALSQ